MRACAVLGEGLNPQGRPSILSFWNGLAAATMSDCPCLARAAVFRPGVFTCSFPKLSPSRPPRPSPASSLMSFLPLIGMFAIMYFMIRPQMKRQKEHKALVMACPVATRSC